MCRSCSARTSPKHAHRFEYAFVAREGLIKLGFEDGLAPNFRFPTQGYEMPRGASNSVRAVTVSRGCTRLTGQRCFYQPGLATLPGCKALMPHYLVASLHRTFTHSRCPERVWGKLCPRQRGVAESGTF